jgi:hypothetical protein
MVTTLMHNQMIMQNDIQKLREEVCACSSRIEELEIRNTPGLLQDFNQSSGTTLIDSYDSICYTKATKKQKLSSLAKQFIPSKIHLSFLQYVKNIISNQEAYDFSLPNVQLVNQIMKDFALPEERLSHEDLIRREAWYRIKITQKIENFKRELKKSEN